MRRRPALVHACMMLTFWAVAMSPVQAQGVAPSAEGEGSLFERVESSESGKMDFDEASVAEHDALACAAGLGCEGLAVSQDDALVLTGHNDAEGAREAYIEQYGDADALEPEPSNEIGEGGADSAADEPQGKDSLFERVEGSESGKKAVEFDEASVAEHDALACAAGLGCEGLAVSQDEALVLTGHNTAEDAREAYQEVYGNPEPESEEEGARQDLSVDVKDGGMSFTEDEATDGGGDMSFTEEEVGSDEDSGLSGEKFTNAEIASFTREQDELWACAAAFGCKGAASGLTPHEALHRLGLPEYSYEWPLAACATNAPGACDEMGISLNDALRIMSHLANPNR